MIVIPLILPFYFWDKTRQERLIARADVADFMLQQLTSDTCLRTAPGVCR